MSRVDFSLNDVKSLIVGEREGTRTMIAHALENEREYTRIMIADALLNEREHTKAMISQEVMSLWDANIGPAFDELHTELAELRSEVKSTRLVVDRHSKDIMELRALHPNA